MTAATQKLSESLRPVMEEWGDPSTLLILIWSALGQILAPMALVVSYNNPRPPGCGLVCCRVGAESTDALPSSRFC